MAQDRKLKILLVEDEFDTCETFKSYFEKRDFIVLTTDSGLKALSIIKSSQPDVVIMDIALKEENGIEALKELRKEDKDTKVIMMTGQQYSDEEIERIKSIGLNGYYEKPVLLEEVSKRIYELTGLQLTPSTKKQIEVRILRDDDCTHDLRNLVGIISQKCENFTLGIKDGIYKTPQERMEKFSVLIDEIQGVVQRSKGFLKGKKKSS